MQTFFHCLRSFRPWGCFTARMTSMCLRYDLAHRCHQRRPRRRLRPPPPPARCFWPRRLPAPSGFVRPLDQAPSERLRSEQGPLFRLRGLGSELELAASNSEPSEPSHFAHSAALPSKSKTLCSSPLKASTCTKTAWTESCSGGSSTSSTACIWLSARARAAVRGDSRRYAQRGRGEALLLAFAL